MRNGTAPERGEWSVRYHSYDSSFAVSGMYTVCTYGVRWNSIIDRCRVQCIVINVDGHSCA